MHEVRIQVKLHLRSSLFVSVVPFPSVAVFPKSVQVLIRSFFFLFSSLPFSENIGW